MESISKLFAELGFKVNKAGLKEFQAQMKALSAGIKAQIQDSNAQTAASRATAAARRADTAEIRKSIAERNLQTASIRTETAELRKLDLQQRMETRAQRQADAQRQRSISSLRSFIVGISAAAYAVTKLTQQTRDRVMAYRDYAFQTGMPLKNLQKLEAAAAQVAPGLTGERIAGELTNLQQNLTNIEFGEGNIFPYQLLGISANTKDATKIVDGLRNAISKLDNVRAMNLIGRMGLSRDWLYVLRMTREEMEKIEAVMLSDKQTNAVIDMSLAFNKLKFSFSNMRDQLVALNSQKLTDFTNNLTAAANAISLWAKEAPEAAAVFDVLAGGVAAFMLRAHPFIAALTAILLLIEDYMVARVHGKSLLDWGQNNPNAKIKSDEGLFKLPAAMGQSIANARNGLKTNAGQEGWVKWANPLNYMQNAEDLTDALLRKYDPLNKFSQPTINNNINMNGYTPMEGGQFIGALNQQQTKISENNMVANQMTTIGSAS